MFYLKAGVVYYHGSPDFESMRLWKVGKVDATPLTKEQAEKIKQSWPIPLELEPAV